jgi:hypothetical protein
VATARERLLQALYAIISRPYSEEGKWALKRLLNSYRVQAKPGAFLEKERTARDILASHIVSSWQQKGSLDKKHIISLINPFRMQIKHGLSRNIEQAIPTVGPKSEQEALGQNARVKVKENISKHQNAYFKDKKDPKNAHLQTAIAGGPLPKKQGRGQCPKCRSMGVVLARSYGNEDYCSCIYCGYQAPLSFADPKLDLPMAAELIGLTFGDPKLEPDD